MENDLTVISGEVFCQKCRVNYVMQVRVTDLHEMLENRLLYSSRPHYEYDFGQAMKFNNLTCEKCKSDMLLPITPDDMDKLNWMFMFCTELIDLCTDDQLHYFCVRNNIKVDPFPELRFRKKLVLAVVREICRQMNPNGPFAN